MTKTILCYGDSLTWGYSAEILGRHAYEDRWPSVLQAELGASAHIIAEGLNGRTTGFDDYMADADRNGVRVLPTILATHAPIDLVVIMLGANDMKPFICGVAEGARQGMQRLVELVRNNAYPFDYPQPEVLIVSPPALCDTPDAIFAAMFAGAPAESKKLAGLYQALATEVGCGYFDAGSVAVTTPLDGVHMDAENTRAVGRGIAGVARKMLKL